MATLKHETDGRWTFTRRARTKFTFDTQGRLTALTDLNGYATTLSYPSSTSTVVTDPAGRKLTLTLTGGRVTSVRDGASPARTVQFAYNGSGELTDVIDVGGGTTHYAYDANHRIARVRSPRYASDTTTSPAPEVSNVYDSAGRVTSQTDPIGRTTTFDYTQVSGSTLVTDPSGNTRLDTYSNGQRVSSTQAYGTKNAAQRTFFYDPETLGLAASCDANGACTMRTFDARGNLLTRADEIGRTTTSTYDGLNDQLTVTDPSGVTTTSTYDSAGNLQSVARPLLSANGTVTATQTVSYGYGGTTPSYAGDVTSMTDPNGKLWQYRYDAYGDRVSETAPPTAENASGNKTTYGYDTATGQLTSTVSPKGNLSGATAANFTTTYARDAFGRITRERDPLWASPAPTAHQVTSHYDLDGNVDQTTDDAGNTTVKTYDAAGQLTKVTRPGSTILRYEYWPNGLMKARTDGANHSTTFTYDVLARLVTRTDPKGRATQLSYDAADNLTVRCQARCTTYGYDAARQQTFINPGNYSTPAITLTYDDLGRRTGMTDQVGASTWTWDSLNRLTANKDSQNSTVSYGYDIVGHQTSVTYPGSQTVTRHYDPAGRMDWLQDYKSNKTTFAYDADSQLTTTTLPSAAGIVDSFAYDNAGSQTAISVKKGTTTLAGFTYTRNGKSQLATSATTGITEAAQQYDYTALGQLKRSGTSATAVPYAYDAADNLTARGSSSTLSYDDANQLCWKASSTVASPSCGTAPSGATTYAYDGSGNRTSSTASGTTMSYTYDELNQLTGYKSTTTYRYDGDGIRTTKTVSGTTTKFVWDRSGSLPMLLADNANAYVYGPTGAPLEQISTDGTVTFLHQDQLGSTRLLTSTAGANVGSSTYDAYGATTATTGSVTTPLRFAGQYTDAESGLQYMRARYYDPTTGQFLGRDPLEATTSQPYSYANSDPVSGLDPSGLFCIDPTGISCGIQNTVLRRSFQVSTVVAAPIAGAAGLAQGYKNVKSGNYAGAALDAAGLVTGGASSLLSRSAARTAAKGAAHYTNPTVGGWLIGDAERLAGSAQRLSFGSYLGQSLLDPYANPDSAYGNAFCP